MITCPSCGEENPERARFCLNCATPLGVENEARPELKFATALFADLVGSTTLAEREDPEVVQSVVGRSFDRLSVEIERYGGLLEKFMGDAMLAVFGVPKAHEDDPERAVRAALEMQAVLSELNHGFAAEGRPQLAMRIGIEAGDVLVDMERAAGPRDRMLTGDAVNTAARLESAADPGHVIVGPAVYASTKDVIDYLEIAPLTLKGKAEPVPAWDAQRVKAKRRGERPSLGLEAKLIGRDEEMTVLKQTLHRVETEGRPAMVTIVGPAGVGKSRVTSELLRYVEGLPQFIYWRSGRCLAYGNTPYSALADAIKAQCEVLEDDPVEVVAHKVDAAVEELFGDIAVAPQVRALVGGGETTGFTREELFEAWRRFLERMAARYPLVLALDDLHWADEGLLDLVEHVADWAQGPILLLVQARPDLFDVRPSWGGGKRNAASIYLDPLTPDEDGAMIDDLLPGEITDELRKLIVERSEGNPLYTEEIIRMLIDRGVLRATEASRWEVAASVADVDVPRSIHGLISARLDGLPDEEKAVLQDAGVVGREFWLGAVVRLSGQPPGVIREVLGRLRIKELIVPHEPSSFSDEPEFSFRHLLIRDGAYDSLPKALRASKHTKIAEWAAERAGDRADEVAILIASASPGGAPVPGGARRYGSGSSRGGARGVSLVADRRGSGDDPVAPSRSDRLVRRGVAARGRAWRAVGGATRHGALPYRGVLRVRHDDRERGGVPSVPGPRRGGRRRARGRMGAGRARADRVPRRPGPGDAGAGGGRRPAARTARRWPRAGVRVERGGLVPVAARGRYEEAEPAASTGRRDGTADRGATRAGRGNDGPGDHARVHGSDRGGGRHDRGGVGDRDGGGHAVGTRPDLQQLRVDRRCRGSRAGGRGPSPGIGGDEEGGRQTVRRLDHGEPWRLRVPAGAPGGVRDARARVDRAREGDR